jgi:hypothetical protein
MINEEKLKDFPTVYYISLKESVNRREFMAKQLDAHGIKHHAFLVDRYSEIKDSIDVRIYPETAKPLLTPLNVGCSVSQIQMMRHWYENTDEDYAIFCDDDANFDSINHWTFTWNEFVENLPGDCHILQLIRMDDIIERYGVDIRLNRVVYWGTARLMTRESVGLLLSILANADGSYNLIAGGGKHLPGVENILFHNCPGFYNFPLLTEFNDENMKSTGLRYIEEGDENYWRGRDRQTFYNYVISKRWEVMGKYLNIREAMVLS